MATAMEMVVATSTETCGDREQERGRQERERQERERDAERARHVELKCASSGTFEGRDSLPAGHGEHVAPAVSAYAIIDEPW